MGRTLFERAGGFAKVRGIVSDLYERVLDSEALGRHFQRVDMRRLVDHQTKFVASLMGGPASFTDEHLKRAHVHMGITDRDFDELLELLQESLEDAGLSDDDVARVSAEFEARRPCIVVRPPAGAAGAWATRIA